MKKINDESALKVIAISGTYVVTLGFNLPENLCNGLLGFSIHRADHTENESYYLQGMKCFQETDPGFPAGSLYSTKEHPIQSFQWADYSAKPGHDYTYTVSALKGTPKNIQIFMYTAVTITTENPNAKNHDVYFNRGTAASQEYIRRFGDKVPDKVPNNAAFDWLSRGLFEAMKLFVQSCEPGKHSLRIAAYEFHYGKFLEVLKKAIKDGVDIHIVYDARKADPRDKNEGMIKKFGIKSNCKGRKEGKSYISHNKFMVKLENGVPISVWTGGTNFSEGGIFGHSNVSHVIEDRKIAHAYFKYWNLLHNDPPMETIKNEVETLTRIPNNPPPEGASPLFSPRTKLDALDYYAKLAKGAQEGLFMTFAFGMNQLFKDVYKNSAAPFRLALMEKATRAYKKSEEQAKKAEELEIQKLRNMPENVFAIGNFISTNNLDGWVKERLTGLNTNVRYVHNKFMLIDPLSDHPIVITGSANFSDASTLHNDENMMVI